MKRLCTMLRDWWRGYSDADVTSYLEKIRLGRPGKIVYLTEREMRALHDDREPRPHG